MSITATIGPMFSGKSSTMTVYLENASRVKNNKCVFICSEKDTRGGSSHISMHNKHFKGQQAFTNVDYIRLSHLTEDILEQYNVFFIDEAQFFPNLYSWCRTAKEVYYHKVFVAGLTTKFDRSCFSEEFAKVICIADHIIHLHGGCDSCARFGEDKPGNYSKRIVPSTEDVLIGDSDAYECWCLECHLLCDWEEAISTLAKKIKHGVFTRAYPRHRILLHTPLSLYEVMEKIHDMGEALPPVPRFVTLQIVHQPGKSPAALRGNYPLYHRTDIAFRSFPSQM